MELGGNDTLAVLKVGEAFEITHDREYIGSIMASLVLTEDMHVVAQAYNFSSSGEGSYTVEPSHMLTYIGDSGTPLDFLAPAQTTTLTVTTIAAVSTPSRRLHLDERASFDGCTPSQRTLISRAIRGAEKYTLDAYYKSNSNSLRYRTWFGAYENVRRAAVHDHFSKIYFTGFDNFIYDCLCGIKDVYA